MMTKRTALADKIMIVGIDGMDPKLTMKYMAEGKMPNTKRILERGVASKDLFMLGGMPTCPPPMWTSMATGVWPNVHGLTDFSRHAPENRFGLTYGMSSTFVNAEQIWNVTAEAGYKTLVWHWPVAWPPTSDSPNLHVVDGTQPTMINGGVARVDLEKIVLAKDTFTEVLYKPAATNNTGAGCVIEDLPEVDDSFDANSILGGDSMSMRNIILSQADGEDGLDAVKLDLCNSPIKDAAGWADALQKALKNSMWSLLKA